VGPSPRLAPRPLPPAAPVEGSHPGPVPAEAAAMIWHPCEFPERAPDRNTGWHMAGCKPCVIACDAWVRSHPDDFLAGIAHKIQRGQMRPGGPFGPPTAETVEWA
jgi:hypothetical protein